MRAAWEAGSASRPEPPRSVQWAGSSGRDEALGKDINIFEMVKAFFARQMTTVRKIWAL